MKPDVARPSFFIGWDVGGWNCERNSKSRDSIVILDDDLTILGQPWRGNLRECIATARSTSHWLKALYGRCQAQYPETPPNITMAVDTPLGFSDEFVNLITRRDWVEAHETSGLNRYLFRYTERHLFDLGLKPLSAVKDMIGSQATKGIHVLAKFASNTESCGVWSDGESLHVIETYPAACRRAEADRSALNALSPLHHNDLIDARVCALVAYLFATRRDAFDDAPPDEAVREGWIWVPKQGTIRELLSRSMPPMETR